MYRFVDCEKAAFPIVTMCRVLGVSPSGFWAWSKRPPSERARADAALTGEIRRIHVRSRGTYGVPRVHAELAYEGTRCSRKRVARLMRADGLAGVHRRRAVRTTVRDRDAASAPDLVNRAFRAPGPDRLWVADITYVPTWRASWRGPARRRPGSVTRSRLARSLWPHRGARSARLRTGLSSARVTA